MQKFRVVFIWFGAVLIFVCQANVNIYGKRMLIDWHKRRHHCAHYLCGWLRYTHKRPINFGFWSVTTRTNDLILMTKISKHALSIWFEIVSIDFSFFKRFRFSIIQISLIHCYTFQAHAKLMHIIFFVLVGDVIYGRMKNSVSAELSRSAITQKSTAIQSAVFWHRAKEGNWNRNFHYRSYTNQKLSRITYANLNVQCKIAVSIRWFLMSVLTPIRWRRLWNRKRKNWVTYAQKQKQKRVHRSIGTMVKRSTSN